MQLLFARHLRAKVHSDALFVYAYY